MNSAFIYVPVISKYSTEVKKSSYDIELKAGAIWYRVVYYEDGKADLKLVVKKETEGWGFGTVGKKYNYENEQLDHEEYAFRRAVLALARNLQVATKEIPEFRLGAQVREVYSNTITFPMGRKEGLKVDDGFDIVELRENPNGEVVQSKVGFARVIRVADNRRRVNAFSRAQVIIGEKLEPGVYVSERPRLPIDLVVGIINNPFEINWIGGTDRTMGYSLYGKLLYNIGRRFDISQLWLGIGIAFGSASFKDMKIMKSSNVNLDFVDYVVIGLNLDLVKKFYLPSRLLLVGKADITMEGVVISEGSGDDEIDLLRSTAIGVTPGLGIEYVATPDLNISLMLGYRLLSTEKIERNLIKVPQVNSTEHSGLTFSFYVSYALPRLPIAIPFFEELIR
jgi:hypothetical protein